MTNLATVSGEEIRRKPPAMAQWNWITGALDVEPEQLEFALPATDEVELPERDGIPAMT